MLQAVKCVNLNIDDVEDVDWTCKLFIDKNQCIQ